MYLQDEGDLVEVEGVRFPEVSPVCTSEGKKDDV